MKNYSYIKIKLLAIIVVLLSIFSMITFYYEKYNIKSEIDNKHYILNKNIKQTFKILRIELRNNIRTKMNDTLFKNDSQVKKQFALKNREELYKLLKPVYDNIKLSNKYLQIMTFRLTDGSTFLRVHKPDMYGDKLNKKRKIILDTNRLKKEQFGFEVGKLKMTYRIVIPIFYQDKHIGLVEIGIEPEYIIDKINNIYNLQNALLIKKDMKSVLLTTKEYNLVANEFYLARGDSLFYKHHNKIVFNIKHNHIIEDGRTYHIDSDLNLKDHNDNITAKVLLAYDTTDNINEFGKMLQMNIFRIILLVLIILTVLNISFNYFINKIISETKKNIRHEKQLSEQSKMVSMGEMIGNIAHQWRQPLSVISTGATGMAVQKECGILSDEQLYETCEIINDNAQYLSQTIDDFRNFIKGDIEKEKFNLTFYLESFLSLVHGSVKLHNITIEKELNDEINIYGYPNEVIQCFMNIFNNAKDAFNEDQNPKLIFISSSISNNNIVIKMKDNANGIPDKILPKIFEPYFTTKHQSQGTGLGLHMTYNLIVDGMGGTICGNNVEYKHKGKSYKGAEFTITLPIT